MKQRAALGACHVDVGTANLTPVELECLSLVAKGLTDLEIAHARFVSVSTVRTHVGRILGKLRVRSRVEAALVYHGIEPGLR